MIDLGQSGASSVVGVPSMAKSESPEDQRVGPASRSASGVFQLPVDVADRDEVLPVTAR